MVPARSAVDTWSLLFASGHAAALIRRCSTGIRQCVQLGIAPAESRRAAARRCLQPGPDLAGPDQFVVLDRIGEPPDWGRPLRANLDVALDKGKGAAVRQMLSGAIRFSILEARWTARPVAV
jgi:hypothetical protein